MADENLEKAQHPQRNLIAMFNFRRLTKNFLFSFALGQIFAKKGKAFGVGCGGWITVEMKIYCGTDGGME